MRNWVQRRRVSEEVFRYVKLYQQGIKKKVPDEEAPANYVLPRGLPGYLILFAPHAFEPQRQFQSSKPPSPLVFLLISRLTKATISSRPERATGHIGTETRPRLLREAAVGNLAQWGKP